MSDPKGLMPVSGLAGIAAFFLNLWKSRKMRKPSSVRISLHHNFYSTTTPDTMIGILEVVPGSKPVKLASLSASGCLVGLVTDFTTEAQRADDQPLIRLPEDEIIEFNFNIPAANETPYKAFYAGFLISKPHIESSRTLNLTVTAYAPFFGFPRKKEVDASIRLHVPTQNGAIPIPEPSAQIEI